MSLQSIENKGVELAGGGSENGNAEKGNWKEARRPQKYQVG